MSSAGQPPSNPALTAASIAVVSVLFAGFSISAATGDFAWVTIAFATLLVAIPMMKLLYAFAPAEPVLETLSVSLDANDEESHGQRTEAPAPLYRPAHPR